MKKICVILAVLGLLTTGTVSAQDWLDALKGMATSAVDKATDGKLTEYALVGTWNYSGPGAKMESDDTTQQLASSFLESAIESQLGNFYEKVGLKPGAGSVTFNKDGSFTASLGGHQVSGNYTFDAQSHKISISLGKTPSQSSGGQSTDALGGLGNLLGGKESSTGSASNADNAKQISMPSIPAGNVYLSGTDLTLVFPITKIVDAIEKVGENVEQLSAVSKLLQGYDNVYVGAKFSKK